MRDGRRLRQVQALAVVHSTRLSARLVAFLEQKVGLHSEAGSNSLDIVERNIALAPPHSGEIRPIHVDFERKRLLAHPACLAEPPNIRCNYGAQLARMIPFHLHKTSQERF